MTTALIDSPAYTDAEFARIVDELTRRGFLAGGIGTAAALGLAACGSSASPTAHTSTGPWTFTDDLGNKISLPRRPQRVIALSDALALTLYSAGLTVVGADMVEGTAAQLRDLGMSQTQVDSIVKLQPGDDLSLEAVVKAQPDLLVDTLQNGKATMLSQYPALTKIAPTVTINIQTATLDHAMTTVHRLVGSLDITLADTRAQARYDQAAARLRTALAAKPGLRVAFCWSNTDGINVSTEDQWGYMRTLGALGMQFTPVKVTPSDYWQTISWENANSIDADLIVLWNGGVPTSPVWRTMPAVKSGQYVDMSKNGGQWFLTSYGNYADNLTTLVKAVESAHVVV